MIGSGQVSGQFFLVTLNLVIEIGINNSNTFSSETMLSDWLF